MIEVACVCDDLPAHSHVYQPQQDGERLTMVPEPFDVRVWVDWRAVARAYALPADDTRSTERGKRDARGEPWRAGEYGDV